MDERFIPMIYVNAMFNTFKPRQNGCHFADDTFKPIFLNENMRISIKISLKIVPNVPINNIPALVQIMAWRRPGDKPLSDPMMVCLLTHICVTRPQRVNLFPKRSADSVKETSEASLRLLSFMMTSSNGKIFRGTGHLCGEFTVPRWIPRIKASDAELWCLLLSAPE